MSKKKKKKKKKKKEKKRKEKKNNELMDFYQNSELLMSFHSLCGQLTNAPFHIGH